MNDEQQIRFGLGLHSDKPFVDAVLDTFDEQEQIRRREHEVLKAEIKALRTENQNYREAYHDQWYNNREIERCWAVIGNYNRKHLELHEAIREYIRNKEWNYEENLHCTPDEKEEYFEIYSPLIKEVIGVCSSGGKENAQQEEPDCEFRKITKAQFDNFGEEDAQNANFPPHSTEQQIKGR